VGYQKRKCLKRALENKPKDIEKISQSYGNKDSSGITNFGGVGECMHSDG
jgi:hypothetical protein